MKGFIISTLQLFSGLMNGVLGEEYRTHGEQEFIQNFVFKFLGKANFKIEMKMRR
jgi:hypothetical protein